MSKTTRESVPRTSQDKSKPKKRANLGMFLIIVINFGIYVADHFFKFESIRFLYEYHDFPAWYQLVTATFCHTNWNHLSGNLFFLYNFGKTVGKRKGNVGLLLSYLLTGVGANLASWLVLRPSSVSIGASGAVFGLFVIRLKLKMSFRMSKVLEAVTLGQFVVKWVIEASKGLVGLRESIHDGDDLLTIIQTVKPVPHILGALVGVVLVWLVSKLLSKRVDHHQIAKRKRVEDQGVKISTKSEVKIEAEATIEDEADVTIDS